MSDGPVGVVYVHGISKHEVGYSVPWYDSMSPHLRSDREFQTFEVMWSDLVNRMAMAGEGDMPPVEVLAAEAELRAEVEAEIQARMEANGQTPAVSSDSGLQANMMAQGLMVDDFIRYMLWKPKRRAILDRFHDVVVPLLEEGRTLQVISHSWGTVVAYEGLRELDERDFPGQIANLFVIGSALSISAVERNVLRRIKNGNLPAIVGHWVNIDAAGDAVGGTIKPKFEVNEEYLELKPTGCKTRRIFRKTAINPICAHSSYFRAANRMVNKRILAHLINN